MGLSVQPLAIADVLLVTPARFADSRGYFSETYTHRVFAQSGIPVDFCQDNQSLSTQRGTVRGLHFQLAPVPQSKLVRVLAGRVFDVAVDLRSGSPSYGQWCGTELTAKRGEQLFIPRGFAHGFCTLEADTVVAYKVDGYYARAAEGGLRWDDPDLGIAWPIAAGDVVVSDKDAVLPLLREAAVPFNFTS